MRATGSGLQDDGSCHHRDLDGAIQFVPVLREGDKRVLVILGVLAAQLQRALLAGPVGEGLHTNVLHLRAGELHAQQHKAELPEHRFHPAPGPGPHLQPGLQVLRVGHLSSDVAVVEPLGGFGVEH